MIIGAHLSISGGYVKAAKKALSIGADTFQFFTRNPRGGAIRKEDPKDIAGLKKILDENGMGPLLAHAPYSYNLCSKKEDVRSFTVEKIEEDLDRMERLPVNLYNIHPGSHTGLGEDEGIRLITEGLNAVLKKEQSTTILLETMSGKGSEIGYRFEQLARIIDGVKLKERVGVCLDTCHVFAAGYDLNDLEGVLKEFDSVLGLERLKALHVNDSKHVLGSRKDRHEKLGQGELGYGPFNSVVRHPLTSALPLFLETPNEDEGYKKEIAYLREIK